MASEFDPHKLSRPTPYVLRMLIFLIVTGFMIFILLDSIIRNFQANIGLNGLILLVLIIGILLSFVQVFRLFREVNWVNHFRIGDAGATIRRPPVLLAPMATLLADRTSDMVLSTQTMRSLLESIAARLDETRDISRYLTGLLVFLGLLGTFWGLLETVSSIADTIRNLNVASNESAAIFEDLKLGLQKPLSGMGTAFSSSLFGLAGSLILGFLELQANQAQNRFNNELEDWLSTFTDLSVEELEAGEGLSPIEDLKLAIDRLARGVNSDGGGSRSATAAMANLAEGIQSLVQHQRSEQQVLREWVDTQAQQQRKIEILLEDLNRTLSKDRNV